MERWNINRGFKDLRVWQDEIIATNQSFKKPNQIVHPLQGISARNPNWVCYNTQSPTANPLLAARLVPRSGFSIVD